MENEYSKEIANAIKRFLIDDDWKFNFDEEQGCFRFGLGMNGRIKNVNYLVRVKKDEYLVYILSPLGPDLKNKKMIARMSEFIHRANFGLRRGNFEMDFNDGEIRYKIYVDCDDCMPSREVIKNSIVSGGVTFKRYAEGILDIIFSDISAEEAIEKCENDDSLLRSVLDRLLKKGDGNDDDDSDGESEDGDESPDLDTLERLLRMLDDDDDDDDEDEEDSDGDGDTEPYFKSELFDDLPDDLFDGEALEDDDFEDDDADNND